MYKEQRHLKEILEQELEWTKKQICLLDQIDEKLHQMKIIAAYAAEHDLQEDEVSGLNTRINILKQEVHMLESQSRGMKC